MEESNIDTTNLNEVQCIKDLLLTRLGRSEHANFLSQWDVISKWANQKEVKTLFFNGPEEPMYQLLRIVALHLGTVDADFHIQKTMPLYHFFDMYYNTYRTYETIQYIHVQLNYWLFESEIKKLMIFCRFLPGSPFNGLNFLAGCLFIEKKAIYNYLRACKKEILCEAGITDYPFELYKEALSNH